MGENLMTTLSVVDQRPYLPVLDTILLWHLDETGSNQTATDAGALGLHGTSTGLIVSTVRAFCQRQNGNFG